MKKVIGIYCGDTSHQSWDEESVRKNGAGGSETWAVEISSEFSKRGFHVIVFGKPFLNWAISPDGVEYVDYRFFEKRCEYQHFDYFIFSRITGKLNHNLSCPNVYVMAEDIFLLDCYNFDDLKLDRVKKIGVISEYQRYNFRECLYRGLKDEQMFNTFNGCDMDLYSNTDIFRKKNQMVWSSCCERGLDFLISDIYPKIKEQVPDFKIYVCSYNENLERFNGIDGVEVLGKLGKKDLANLQMESKIWIYPNDGYSGIEHNAYFHETFCITAVENAFAKNAIVCLNAGGLSSTLEGYSNFAGHELISNKFIDDGYGAELYFNIVSSEKRNILINEIVTKSVEILRNDEKRIELANECYDICKKYTWDNAVDTWLKEWGLI